MAVTASTMAAVGPGRKMAVLFRTARNTERSVAAMTTKPLPILLIPGAWMGAWIWDDTVERLAEAGCAARSPTLTGLDPQASRSDISQVRLANHVADVERALCAIDEPVMVVGHSYSGLLAGIVADRLPDFAVHTTVVCGFFPRDGRSLLDDWGPMPTPVQRSDATSSRQE